jgi:hypothetical protein
MRAIPDQCPISTTAQPASSTRVAARTSSDAAAPASRQAALTRVDERDRAAIRVDRRRRTERTTRRALWRISLPVIAARLEHLRDLGACRWSSSAREGHEATHDLADPLTLAPVDDHLILVRRTLRTADRGGGC